MIDRFIADRYTNNGFTWIALNDNKKPIEGSWTDKRGKLRTNEDCNEWFDNGRATKAIGIIIHNTEFGIDTDGNGEYYFIKKIYNKFSKDLQNAFDQTTHTKTPNGHHRLFRTKEQDFPGGINGNGREYYKGNAEHEEIKLICKDHYLVECGPGYEEIKSIESVVTLSKGLVNELLKTLERFKLETSAIRTVSNSLRQYYKKPNRQNLSLRLSGFLHKTGVPEYLIHDTIECIIAITKDEEFSKRFQSVKNTCSKEPKSEHVSGYNKLLEAVDNNKNVISEISHVFHDLGYGTSNDIQEGEEELEPIISFTKQIMNEYSFATMTDNGEICYYDNERGFYLPNAEWKIKAFIQSIRPGVSTHIKQEVINQIKDSTYVDRSKFDSDPDIINLKNGLLNIHTLELIEHSSKHYLLSSLPVTYDPKAKCPKFMKFLSEILRPKDIFIMLQLIGYSIYKTAKYEKAAVFIGKGDNGKSTLIKRLEYFFGKENTSNVSLQDLSGGDKFATADMFGKMINVFADLKSDKIQNTGNFKMIVSGDTIRAQKKGIQGFNFNNYAKLWFSCNTIPESDDTGYAYFKRWLIFHFERAFTGKDRNNNLLNELVTEAEDSGLLNLALIALKQLIKDNGFIHSDDIDKVAADYRDNSSGVERFVHDKCIVTKNENDYVICRDLFGLYFDYCEENKIKVKDDNVFGMELAEMHIVRDRIRVSKVVREYGYVGIKLK